MRSILEPQVLFGKNIYNPACGDFAFGEGDPYGRTAFGRSRTWSGPTAVPPPPGGGVGSTAVPPSLGGRLDGWPSPTWGAVQRLSLPHLVGKAPLAALPGGWTVPVTVHSEDVPP